MHNIQYETYVDKNARKRRKKPDYELQTFYGRLEHVITITFANPAALDDLDLNSPTTVALAVLRTCTVSTSDQRLDIHYYADYGGLDVLDIQSIQCVVGRIPVSTGGDNWAIVDRSGSLSRALAVIE